MLTPPPFSLKGRVVALGNRRLDGWSGSNFNELRCVYIYFRALPKGYFICINVLEKASIKLKFKNQRNW